MILSNRNDKIVASGVFDLGISDPIACIRDTRLQRTKSPIVVRRNLRNFNEQAFLRDLCHSNISTILEISDIELALDHFVNTFSFSC